MSHGCDLLDHAGAHYPARAKVQASAIKIPPTSDYYLK